MKTTAYYKKNSLSMTLVLFFFLQGISSKLIYNENKNPMDYVISTCNQSDVPLIWPHPQQYTAGTNVRIVQNPLVISCDQQSPLLQAAFQRYQSLIFTHKTNPLTTSTKNKVSKDILTDLKVIVEDPSEEYPHLKVNETYTLIIPEQGQAILTSKTVYGALRGLETLSQLIQFNFDKEHYQIVQIPWLIHDFPRFQHRGLMIDTARHFLPLSHIKAIIDSMTFAKFNVLHLHLVDEQSFPIQSITYPKLWNAAFSKSERYLQSDLAEIVKYAKLRGIRVILELDMPGHANSWCTGYPDLCPSSTCKSPLNPSTNATFEFIANLLGELTGGSQGKGIFPDDFVHLGGDEVDTQCWNKVESIKKWMDSNNMDANQAYMYFVKRVAEITISQGRTPIQWVEVYENFKTQLDKKTVVHVWKDKDILKRIVQDGYRTLLSDSGNLYLDNVRSSWLQMYLDDPHEGIPEEQQHLVLGGQVEMWGEKVDGSDLQSTVWPRSAAFAERLWSHRDVVSTECALKRIQEFRCILLDRGVAAPPVSNEESRSAPLEPGTCRV